MDEDPVTRCYCIVRNMSIDAADAVTIVDQKRQKHDIQT